MQFTYTCLLPIVMRIKKKQFFFKTARHVLNLYCFHFVPLVKSSFHSKYIFRGHQCYRYIIPKQWFSMKQIISVLILKTCVSFLWIWNVHKNIHGNMTSHLKLTVYYLQIDFQGIVGTDSDNYYVKLKIHTHTTCSQRCVWYQIWTTRDA